MDGQLGYWSLNVDDTASAREFFGELFGWRFSPPGERGGINASGLWGGFHPVSLGISAVSFAVADAEKTAAHVRDLGGTAPDAQPQGAYGAYVEAVDPAGLHFGIWQPAPGHEPPTQAATGHGQVGYFALRSPDRDRSAEFFAELFGWRYGSAGSAGGLPIEGSSPLGFVGGSDGPDTGGLTFYVDDALVAVETIRRLGGVADDPEDSPYGPYAHATDQQGTRFAIWQSTLA